MVSRRSPGSRSRPTSAWYELPHRGRARGPSTPAEAGPGGPAAGQAAIQLLAGEPRPSGAKKLVGGDGEWRVRTGDYRIGYEIHDNVLLVLVVAVGHRRDIIER